MSFERELPQFADESAADERYGFDYPHFGTRQLPGQSWAEGNMFSNSVFWLPNCNMDKGIFNDTVWQYRHPDRLRVFEKPEDRVLLEIFYNDAVRRLQAVEQLTLPPQYTTVPNTGAFSRFEHIWGSVLFVRQMAQQQGITGKEAVTLQLRTLVSDIAHTFGSHLGDWMFQGVGGKEDQHDIELNDYLQMAGINDILRNNGFEPSEVIFPKIQDWVEADQPDLCVDRVDYGLREMNRWNDVVRSLCFTSEDFALTPEGMLAMTDQRRARVFSEGFLLLSQEHWSEPTHRFMIDMLILRTKLFYGQGGTPRSWVFKPLPESGLVDLHTIHPRDLMYVTDPAQQQAYGMPNLGGHILQSIMTSIAEYRRKYVWPGRAERIGRYLDQFVSPDSYQNIVTNQSYTSIDDPSFNTFLNEYPPTLPNGFAILSEAQAAATKNDMCIDFPQPPFKSRQIDPLIQTGDGFKRLSELDPSYADRLLEHRRSLQRTNVARLAIADPTSLTLMKSMVENVEASWQARLETSRRMSSDELKALVNVSASEIFGSYSFMTFLDY